MSKSVLLLGAAWLVGVGALAASVPLHPSPNAPSNAAAAVIASTDLDDFMAKVLAHRDDNWKKLQQYILDEHEVIDVRSAGATPLWGDTRDYMWFVRDGFFVRSPLKANGVDISDAERRKYEDDYLKEQKKREAMRARTTPPAPSAPALASDAAPSAADMEGLLKQTRQPEFIQSAYFLRFKFEQGKYALVGRESLEGRSVLRIEYYPARLFSHEQDQSRRNQQSKTPPKPGTPQAEAEHERAYDAAVEAAMNKVSLVTIWVDEKQFQILKYTFDNVNVDFLPGSWLFHVNDLRASMTMSQPFPDVWLPHGVEMNFGIMTAVGPVKAKYTLDYSNYRLASTSTRIKIPPSPTPGGTR